MHKIIEAETEVLKVTPQNQIPNLPLRNLKSKKSKKALGVKTELEIEDKKVRKEKQRQALKARNMKKLERKLKRIRKRWEEINKIKKHRQLPEQIRPQNHNRLLPLQPREPLFPPAP